MSKKNQIACYYSKRKIIIYAKIISKPPLFYVKNVRSTVKLSIEIPVRIIVNALPQKLIL